MPCFAALALALVFALASGAEAQSANRSGRSASPARLHVGMWTSHLRAPTRGLESNWLVAIGWRGVYGGTFINSFGDRAFALGWEKPWARRERGTVGGGIGYRVGVVTGYDDRFISLAGKFPVLPVAQVVGDLAMGPSGVEVSWSGLVASVAPYMRVPR